MGDGENTIEYYKRYPDTSYKNTVAYGMFAANDLKDSLWHWTIDTKLRRKKYDFEPYDYRYSDLGFYLLQMLTERTSGIELDNYVDSLFYKPIGMGTMTYNPLCKFQLKRITPTERDRHFRHVLVWGTVHDQIAAMKGGVSGHAGLFSNAHDVAKIMQLQLQDGMYGGKQLLNPKTIRKYTAYHSAESRRGLGWDKPEKREDEFSPVSRYASHESFGHTGFTGTIAWADPTFDLVFVFLSNRIYPDMSNKKLNQYNIRTRLQEVVYESIWNFEKAHN
jgi:CubicO group peptidase (beta-lactamase class C family)